MRLLHLPLSLLVISLLGYGTATGQERPDFTGTWVMDVNRSETAGQAPEMLRRAPVTLIIAQSPDELIIETEANGRRESVTYSFTRRQDPPRPVGTSGSNDSTVQEALGGRGKTADYARLPSDPRTGRVQQTRIGFELPRCDSETGEQRHVELLKLAAAAASASGSD